MSMGRWEERCVQNYGDEVEHFLDEHFKNNDRTCLLISGAGFDPRSTVITECLEKRLKDRLSIFLIREHRPNPDQLLVQMGDDTVKKLKTLYPDLALIEIDIFSVDSAVIGGVQVLAAISKFDFNSVNDIILDTSAMSIGISFPIAKFLFDSYDNELIESNFHIMLASNPALDSNAIKSEPNDVFTEVRGFELGELMSNTTIPKFWLPLVSERKMSVLKIIYDALNPQDICPILPFPSASDPKKTDRVASALWKGIEREMGGISGNEWDLDPKDFVFAGERKPLDIYRTILRIQREREPVFEIFGGSKLVLSPMGSKIPALGILMVAMEMKAAVVYVESLKYTLEDQSSIIDLSSHNELSHIWLMGEAYL